MSGLNTNLQPRLKCHKNVRFDLSDCRSLPQPHLPRAHERSNHTHSARCSTEHKAMQTVSSTSADREHQIEEECQPILCDAAAVMLNLQPETMTYSDYI